MLGKKKSLVGLDIGASEVKAIELTQAGESLRITGFGRSPIESKEGLQDTIADTLRRAGIKTKRVATAVSGRAVIIRYINMARMSDDELRSAVKFEADKYIPFQVDEVILDCVKLPDFGEGSAPDAEKEMKVLLVAVKKTLIEEHLQVMQTLGLVPTVIDVDTFAIGNAFELSTMHSPRIEDEDKVIALVDIGCVKTNINIHKNKTSYFSREVYVAGNEFTEAIARRIGCEAGEAEKIKLNPAGKEDMIEESIIPVLDELANEIHLSFDYYENQYERQVDEVYISGGSCKIPGVKASFERTFDKAIHLWDPTENLEVNSDRVDTNELKEHSGQVAVAVGLASRILA